MREGEGGERDRREKMYKPEGDSEKTILFVLKEGVCFLHLHLHAAHRKYWGQPSIRGPKHLSQVTKSKWSLQIMKFSLFLRAELILSVDWLVLGSIQPSFEYFQGWILLCDPGVPVPPLEGFFPPYAQTTNSFSTISPLLYPEGSLPPSAPLGSWGQHLELP